MVEKPLPPALVKELTRLAPHLEKRLPSMENVDHRKGGLFTRNRRDVLQWGGRVRQLNVSKNFPGVEVVVKRDDGDNAKGTLAAISREVDAYELQQSEPSNAEFILRRPYAYAISDKLIAMAKTDKPNIREILGDKTPYYNKGGATQRGRTFFSKLKKEHQVSEEQLITAVRALSLKTNLTAGNVIVAGVENGKFVFIPLADLL